MNIRSKPPEQLFKPLPISKGLHKHALRETFSTTHDNMLNYEPSAVFGNVVCCFSTGIYLASFLNINKRLCALNSALINNANK